MRTLVVALVLLAGCAHAPPAGRVLDAAVSIGRDALTCAPAELGAVQDAIAHGGADWLSVAVASFQCLGPAIQAVERMLADAGDGPLMLADAGDAVPEAVRPSRGIKRRLAAARVFATLLQRNVLP